MACPPSSSTRRAKAALCSVLLMTTLAACHGSPAPDRLLAEAQQYRQRGETRAAIIQLKNVLQKEPDNTAARALLGAVYIDAGDPLSAEKELRKAQALGMAPAALLPDLGRAMLMMGQPEQVLADIRPDPAGSGPAGSGPAGPGQPALQALRAEAYLALGDTAQARALYQRILSQQPDASAALLGLARIALAEHHPDQAGDLIGQALAKHPDDIDSLRLQGDWARMQGDSEAARRAYARILALRPDHSQTQIDLAHLDLQAGKLDDAKSRIEAARKSAPNSLQVIHAQALLDFRAGRLKPALDALQQVLKAAPHHMPSILLMSAVQIALGSPDQAEHYLQSFLAANPKHVYASKMLATIALGRGKPDSALGIVMPLLRAEPDDTELLALAGEAEMRARRFGKAADLFQKASELAPKSASLHTALAMSRLGIGENARAIAELERASALDTKSARAGVMLVMTHLRAKDYDKALAAANAMEQQQADNPLVHNLKGGVWLARREPAAARASFEQALRLDPGYLPALENLAQLDLGEKKAEQARRRFEAALAKDPKNAGLMIALSKLAAAQDKPAEALRWLERASKDNPDALAPAILLSGAYLRAGDKQKALVLARQLRAGHPDNADALALLAQVERDSGERAAALESYQKLALLQPHSSALQMRIANLQMGLDDQAGALESVRKARSLEPDLLEAQVTEVALLLAKGKHADALKLAQALQVRHPDLPAGFKLEGDVLMAQKQALPALKRYEQAYDKSKIGPLQVNIHQALMLAGKTQEAGARIHAWLQAHPTDLPTRFYLAGTSLSSKNYRSAIEQYEKIVQQDPKNSVALNDLAWSYQQEKDGRALATAERAHQLDTGNPASLDTLGWILLEQGQSARALPLLQKAAGLAPRAAEIQYHLGLGLMKAGDKRGARAQFEKLLAEQQDLPNRAEVQALLAQL